jgi:hypothetical protein
MKLYYTEIDGHTNAMKGSRIELEATSLGRASVAGFTISRYPLEAI